jgi:hypothetical protein
MNNFEVRWVKQYGHNTVVGTVEGDEVILIYGNGVQSSRTLPVKLELAQPIVECYKAAIDLWQKGAPLDVS